MASSERDACVYQPTDGDRHAGLTLLLYYFTSKDYANNREHDFHGLNAVV